MATALPPVAGLHATRSGRRGRAVLVVAAATWIVTAAATEGPAATDAAIVAAAPDPVASASLPAALTAEVYRLLAMPPGLILPASAAADRRNAPALCRALGASGRSLFDLGTDLMARLERQAAAAAPSQPFDWGTFDSEHFLFVAPTASRAWADRAHVEYLAEDVLQQTWALVGGPPAAADLGVWLATPVPSPPAVADEVRSAKIVVVLHPEHEGSPLEHGEGATRLGATLADGGGAGDARFTLRVDVVYQGLLSLTVLAHEVGHAAVLLALLEVEQLSDAHDGRSLRRAFGRAYQAPPPLLLEGLGDHALYYQGFYAVWGALPAPEAILAELLDTGRVPSITDLLRTPRHFAGTDHKVASLAAATFVHHLVATGGAEPLRAWLRASRGERPATFEGVFGVPLVQAEASWLEAVLAAPGGCPP